VPALFVAYWSVRASRSRLPWTAPLIWSAYPLAYLACALVRGEIIERYPHPFIDVGMIGYVVAIRNAIGPACGFMPLVTIFVWVTRTRARFAGIRS
jgi:hypothetical protein